MIKEAGLCNILQKTDSGYALIQANETTQFDSTYSTWKERGLTSIYILTPKVISVEEHEFDPVALVQRHQANQQQEDSAQTSGQLHRVHQLS